MKIFPKLNSWRRKTMRKLTKNVGSSKIGNNIQKDKSVTIKRVLISRPNSRLGNMLLITPLIIEIENKFPNAKIDIFTRAGVAPILFSKFENVDRIIQLPKKPFKQLAKYVTRFASVWKYKYDLVINVVANSSSGRLSTKFASSDLKIFGDIESDSQIQNQDHLHVAKYPVYNLRRFLSMLGFEDTNEPIPTLTLKLAQPEREQGAKLLQDLVGNFRKTICIFTYATGTKRYSAKWWSVFYERLQTEFGADYNIVEVLPMENVSQIDFKAPTFYSKDVREIAAFIGSTSVFIGADSGIMHLASASGAPTIGLFGISKAETFGPYGNENLAIDTRKIGIDEIFSNIRSVLSGNSGRTESISK